MDNIAIERFLHEVVKNLMNSRPDTYLINDKKTWTRLLTFAVAEAIETWKASPGLRAAHRYTRDPWGSYEHDRRDVVGFSPDRPWADASVIVELENNCYYDRVQYDAWKLLTKHTEARFLYAYFGWRTQYKDFDALRKAVAEVHNDHKGKLLVLCGGLNKTALKSNDDLLEYFSVHILS